MAEGILRVIPDIMAALPDVQYMHSEEGMRHEFTYAFNNVSFRDLAENFDNKEASKILNILSNKDFSLGAVNIFDIINSSNRESVLNNLKYLDGYENYEKEILDTFQKILNDRQIRSIIFSPDVQIKYCKNELDYRPSFAYATADSYYVKFIYKFLIGSVKYGR